MTSATDWASWHSPYDDPTSPLSQRLALVRGHISEWLDTSAGSLTVVSVCAGDGRDLLGVLASRPDSERVTATLVELDPRLVQRARSAIEAAGLAGVTVREADAGLTDEYGDAGPADLLLLCGVFGNVSDDDVRRTIEALPGFCRRGAIVIWTRHTRDPDLTPRIRAWFADAGFVERSFTAPADAVFSVGVHHFEGAPQALAPGQRLFNFLR